MSICEVMVKKATDAVVDMTDKKEVLGYMAGMLIGDKGLFIITGVLTKVSIALQYSIYL